MFGLSLIPMPKEWMIELIGKVETLVQLFANSP